MIVAANRFDQETTTSSSKAFSYRTCYEPVVVFRHPMCLAFLGQRGNERPANRGHVRHAPRRSNAPAGCDPRQEYRP